MMATPFLNASVNLSGIGGGGNAYIDTMDATDNYHLVSVAAGTFSISAVKAGYTPSTLTFVNVPYANSVMNQNKDLVSNSACVTIVGIVTDTVAGQAGKPIAGVKVILQSGFGGGIRDSAVTGVNGAIGSCRWLHTTDSAKY
jgi:hypothetical protein